MGRRLLRILIPPAIVAVALAIAGQFDSTRRLAVWLLDPMPTPAAAATVDRLEGRIDGPDVGRKVVRVVLEPVITQVPQPTDLAPVPGHEGRWVVLSKAGTAYLARAGEPPVPWFTLDVATTSELGLLGIAFHPKFATNGRFFVNANPELGSRYATRIVEGKVDPATLQSPVVDRVLLEFDQPYQNHDGGQVAFGPDGLLYVASGDGGYRDDPHGNGQKLGTLLGKILRIDVDQGTPYGIPADNPFVGRSGARGEIWAYGLRNPWRFSFDPRGRLITGDVGQNKFEEIDVVVRGGNYGWKIREAEHCFEPREGCKTAGLVDPIWSYPREEGISVTGGVVWTAPGPLSGQYVFGDYGTGRLWALTVPDGQQRVGAVTALGRFGLSPSAFARAPDGSVWVADFGRGAIHAMRIAE